jgi:hypothetical protein
VNDQSSYESTAVKAISEWFEERRKLLSKKQDSVTKRQDTRDGAATVLSQNQNHSSNLGKKLVCNPDCPFSSVIERLEHIGYVGTPVLRKSERT